VKRVGAQKDALNRVSACCSPTQIALFDLDEAALFPDGPASLRLGRAREDTPWQYA
jgi:hypothetical protein